MINNPGSYEKPLQQQMHNLRRAISWNVCVKQYTEDFWKGFNAEMKLERFPALLRSVKMGLQWSNMSHSV